MLTNAPLVTAVTTPVATCRTRRLMLFPSSSAVNARYWPSGDHSGDERYSLSRRISSATPSPRPPFTRMRQREPSMAKATHCPSGDQAGHHGVLLAAGGSR
jgi:hypothetical protein